MLKAALIEGHAEIAEPTPAPPNSSIAQLIQQLSTEADTAEKRIHSLQTAAGKAFVEQQRRLTRFVACADRIHAILLPRLKAFTTVPVFRDIQLSVEMEFQRPKIQGLHARTATLTAASSDKRPTPMKFSFRVGHDGAVNNAVIDYRVELLPIFIKFDSHDQLMIPIDTLSEDAVSAWIDEKLLTFTKLYFEVFFHHEYQKRCLETDPVLNITFPRAMALSTKEYQGRRYHFYTDESFQLFEKDPAAYIESMQER